MNLCEYVDTSLCILSQRSNRTSFNFLSNYIERIKITKARILFCVSATEVCVCVFVSFIQFLPHQQHLQLCVFFVLFLCLLEKCTVRTVCTVCDCIMVFAGVWRIACTRNRRTAFWTALCVCYFYKIIAHPNANCNEMLPLTANNQDGMFFRTKTK